MSGNFASKSSAAAVLARMTLEQKAGQVMAVGFDGTAVDPEMLEMIQQFCVGGAILFGRNVESPAQVAGLTNQLQAAARDSGRPGLMLSIDQEGGRVARLTEASGFTEFPSAMALGAAGSLEGVRLTASAMAAELRAVGLNADLAPVLDVNNNAANPVIGTRSFGFDPRQVADLGTAFLLGMQSAGVLACAKHFPGHGDTSQDSHFSLPVVAHGWDRLEAVELLPFRAAIQAGVGAIMSAHINFAALEPDGLPGTLSPRVMTGLVREKLGYTGLLATDSLEMGALARSGYPVPLAAATALQAGADLLLFNREHNLHRQAHALIVEWVRSGKIPLARLDQAALRVLEAKARFGMLHPRPVDPQAAGQVCGSPEHRALAREWSKKAILVRMGSVSLPVRSALVLEVPGAAGLAERGGLPSINVPENPGAAEISTIVAQARASAAQCAVIALVDAHFAHPAQLELARAISEAGIPLVAAALRSPFDLDHLPREVTALATYGNNPPALDALAEHLFGTSRNIR